MNYFIIAGSSVAIPGTKVTTRSAISRAAISSLPCFKNSGISISHRLQHWYIVAPKGGVKAPIDRFKMQTIPK